MRLSLIVKNYFIILANFVSHTLPQFQTVAELTSTIVKLVRPLTDK